MPTGWSQVGRNNRGCNLLLLRGWCSRLLGLEEGHTKTTFLWAGVSMRYCRNTLRPFTLNLFSGEKQDMGDQTCSHKVFSVLRWEFLPIGCYPQHKAPMINLKACAVYFVFGDKSGLDRKAWLPCYKPSRCLQPCSLNQVVRLIKLLRSVLCSSWAYL